MMLLLCHHRSGIRNLLLCHHHHLLLLLLCGVTHGPRHHRRVHVRQCSLLLLLLLLWHHHSHPIAGRHHHRRRIAEREVLLLLLRLHLVTLLLWHRHLLHRRRRRRLFGSELSPLRGRVLLLRSVRAELRRGTSGDLNNHRMGPAAACSHVLRRCLAVGEHAHAAVLHEHTLTVLKHTIRRRPARQVEDGGAAVAQRRGLGGVPAHRQRGALRVSQEDHDVLQWHAHTAEVGCDLSRAGRVRVVAHAADEDLHVAGERDAGAVVGRVGHVVVGDEMSAEVARMCVGVFAAVLDGTAEVVSGGCRSGARFRAAGRRLDKVSACVVRRSSRRRCWCFGHCFLLLTFLKKQ
eukprot:PhM_4_TR18464/c1_g1_i2/m.77178